MKTVFPFLQQIRSLIPLWLPKDCWIRNTSHPLYCIKSRTCLKTSRSNITLSPTHGAVFSYFNPTRFISALDMRVFRMGITLYNFFFSAKLAFDFSDLFPPVAAAITVGLVPFKFSLFWKARNAPIRINIMMRIGAAEADWFHATIEIPVWSLKPHCALASRALHINLHSSDIWIFIRFLLLLKSLESSHHLIVL